MYPNYPHDSEAQHVDVAMRAIEGDQSHLRVQRGSVTLNLTAGVTGSQTVTCTPPFTPNTTPFVYLTPSSVGDISAKLNIIAASVTNTSFSLQAYSDQAQSVTIQWLAIGKAE